MNWVRNGFLLITAALAYGAPGNEPGGAVPPATRQTTDGIAAAREALQQATAAYGEHHPATAMMLSNLALAMREAGYNNYAERYAQQAVAILEKHFGPNDVSLAPPLNVLAEAAVSEGRYAEARAFAGRVIALGPAAETHYATALHNMAAAYQAEGRFQEAAEYYRRALAARLQFLSPDHPFVRLDRAALQQVQRSAKMVARR